MTNTRRRRRRTKRDRLRIQRHRQRLLLLRSRCPGGAVPGLVRIDLARTRSRVRHRRRSQPTRRVITHIRKRAPTGRRRIDTEPNLEKRRRRRRHRPAMTNTRRRRRRTKRDRLRIQRHRQRLLLLRSRCPGGAVPGLVRIDLARTRSRVRHRRRSQPTRRVITHIRKRAPTGRRRIDTEPNLEKRRRRRRHRPAMTNTRDAGAAPNVIVCRFNAVAAPALMVPKRTRPAASSPATPSGKSHRKGARLRPPVLRAIRPQSITSPPRLHAPCLMPSPYACLQSGRGTPTHPEMGFADRNPKS